MMAEAYGIDLAGSFLRIYTNEAEANQVVSRLEMGRVVPLCRETPLTSNVIPLHQVLSDLVHLVDNPKTEATTLSAALRNARALLRSVRDEQEKRAPLLKVAQ